MPARERPPPSKKRKVEASSKQSYKYVSAADIRRVFQAQSEAGLIEGLTSLRNQLTVKANEPPVQVTDERLLLARSWLDEDPGAQELFAIWEGTNARQMSLLAVIVGLLSSLLNLLSSHYTYHTYAQPIMRNLLSQESTHHLNLYLAGTHTDLVLVTLKLYNSLSAFAGGRERKVVLDAFAWEMKSLPKLLHMRRKAKSGEDIDMLARPDIRTLYILLVTSFIDSSTPSSVKVAFLEQHRDAFTSIFKGLSQDPYSVIRHVLEVCWSGLWSDAKLKRTLKIQVFNESTLSQLLRIYERNVPESDDPESVPADVVHHFLLALCSRPGVGLCFQDRGWYPREVEDAEERVDNDKPQKGGRIYNKILANVLKTLKVNEDPRQQELALKILSACPELVSGYWSSSGLALEPRLSSKWLANIAFYGAVVALPVPASSFFLPESGSDSASLYQPVPPPLPIIVENIIPTAHMKTHLSRGLQAPSPLVQHVTALALAKCLMKYEQVISSFLMVERALEEDENDGLWARRRREIEREVRRRVPEFQVIVGFSQRSNEVGGTSSSPDKEKQKETAPNPTRAALLAESAHRLLCLYHRLLPSVVAEARFDAGKLLQAIEDMLSQGSSTNPTAGLDTLRQLHVLRLLQDSEHFTWSGKSGSKHSNFYILLKAYTITPTPAVRGEIVALLRHILAPGVLFQHDADEITLWLESLPFTRRAPGAKASDSTPLTDEGDSVISFLDDCVQRCIKTPYKYVEDLAAAYSTSATDSMDTSDGLAGVIGERPEEFPSPLLATVVEQLGAKLRSKLLTPSDALALFAFIRKLLLRLSSKSVDLVLPRAFSERVATLVHGQAIFPEHVLLEKSIQREVALLGSSMERLQNPVATEATEGSSSTAREYLIQVEAQSADIGDARIPAAYDIVDWLRLSGCPLSGAELGQYIAQVGRLHKPALKEFLQYVDPRQQSLWKCVTDVSLGVKDSCSFDILFLHCTDELIEDPTCQRILIDSAFAGFPTFPVIKRAIYLILHRLSRTEAPDAAYRDWLSVLAGIIHKSQENRIPNVSAFVQLCVTSETLKRIFANAASEVVREGLSRLLDVCSAVVGQHVTELVSAFSGRWALALRESLDNMSEDQRTTALLWIKFLSAQEILSLLDYLADRAEHSSSAHVRATLGDILEAASDTLTLDLDATTQALPLLCRIQAFIPESPQLTSLVAAGTKAALPLCHDGFIPSHSFSEWNVASLVPASSKRWSLRLQPTPPLSVASFLAIDELSDPAVDIIATMLYRQTSVRTLIAEWLGSSLSTERSTLHLVKILFAFYDSLSDSEEAYGDSLQSHLTRLLKVVVEDRHPRETCSMASSVIVAIVASSHSNRSKYLKALVKELDTIKPEKCSPYVLSVAAKLQKMDGTEAVAEHALDLGLRWAVRHFADEQSSSDACETMPLDLVSLINGKTSVKSHLAEPVIVVVVQDRLSDKQAVRFARLLASTAHLKPASVNKYLQTVVQHAKFYEYCALGAPSRADIISFLHTLFHLHPSNTCQPSHIDPLRRVYGGSLSSADLQILSVLQLFEATRKASVASMLSQWSAASDVSSGSTLEAIQSLDAGRVLKTCLEYPEWRKLSATSTSESNDSLYDPAFVLLLFAQMLAESAPSSALAWIQLFRTNVVSLLLRTLSAKDVQIRDIAWAQVAALYRSLETADLQEKTHVLHILNLLKDLTSPSPSDEPPRLPAYTTLLLAHAFRGVFYPSNFIYPLTARFLLQRPSLDPSDVPMLYGMLYSSSDDWKKERAWIVRFLSDGIVGNEEWRILKRRHTWDLLASLFQSDDRDRSLRRGVLEVLANVTCNARATASLILRHALLSWIEMQLPTMRGDEAIAWVRILENILAVVNSSKIEASTDHEWRAIVARCIRSIVEHSAYNQAVFVASCPVLLRLSLLPGPPNAQIPRIVTRNLHWLAEMEKEVAIPTSGSLVPPLLPESALKVPTLHRSQHLFDPPPSASVEVWGACVEALWRVSMSNPERTEEWDALSNRLLIWRSIVGAEGSRIGEWVRREVVESLRVDDV